MGRQNRLLVKEPCLLAGRHCWRRCMPNETAGRCGPTAVEEGAGAEAVGGTISKAAGGAGESTVVGAGRGAEESDAEGGTVRVPYMCVVGFWLLAVPHT